MRILDVDPLFEGETPYYVMLRGGNAFVKSGNGNTPIVPSKLWDKLTPEIEAKANLQGFRKITLSVNGAPIYALEGGGKVIVGKMDYGTIVNSQNESGAADPVLGDIGDLDQNDIANIQNPDAFEWQALRNQIIDAKQKGVAPEEIAKLQAQYDQLAGGKADAWEQTYAKVQAQKAKDQEQYPGKVQYVQESIELDRIKHLSKVLRG